jgi:predicted DCC family thiol-disulfide oxidoreductase YuxK
MFPHPIILFDGICNLCNGAVQFVIKRDKKNLFRFASLQSEEAQQILKEHHCSLQRTDSFFLIENGKVFDRSTAALKVVQKLDGLWPLLYGLIVVPPFIRDGVYKIIAKNRYRWFGQKNTCMIPTPENKAKFLH